MQSYYARLVNCVITVTDVQKVKAGVAARLQGNRWGRFYTREMGILPISPSSRAAVQPVRRPVQPVLPVLCSRSRHAMEWMCFMMVGLARRCGEREACLQPDLILPTNLL